MAPDALDRIEYGDARSVLLFASSEAALREGRLTIERAGCRVADAALVEGGAERLDRQVHADALLVELDGETAGLDALLERVGARARELRQRSVVSAPESLIDAVAARAWHRDVFHLCRASEMEKVAAVALASVPRRLVLHDVARDETPALLQQLSDEVARIASVLATLAEEEGGAPAGDALAGEAAGGGRDAQAVDARLVRSIIRARRLRDRYFKGGLFADPAWDMLLDLMAARLENVRVAVSSLCIAAAVPPTTALRWIKTLTDQGLLVRCADPQDGRRVYIELSDEAARALAAYIRAAQRISPLGL